MSHLMISSDSHVIEPHDLWIERLPSKHKDQAPKYPARTNFEKHDGGKDPTKRVTEMAKDGVSSEVLYASLGLTQFGFTDVDLQEACFRVYNDWLIEYCSHARDRLFGIGLISCYNIDRAVVEVERCKRAGMRGVMVWQVPPEELAFSTKHYERLWSACGDMQMPVSLHILTGTPYGLNREIGTELAPRLTAAVNKKLFYTCESLMQIIASGALERHPKLKLVLVETEISWLPYALSQWDKYLNKGNRSTGALKLLPSEYFKRQVYATFFNDSPANMIFSQWGGVDNFMWSNDFPHGNSTWPNSREVVARDVANLPDSSKEKLLWKNCAQLYDLPVLEPVGA